MGWLSVMLDSARLKNWWKRSLILTLWANPRWWELLRRVVWRHRLVGLSPSLGRILLAEFEIPPSEPTRGGCDAAAPGGARLEGGGRGVWVGGAPFGAADDGREAAAGAGAETTSADGGWPRGEPRGSDCRDVQEPTLRDHVSNEGESGSFPWFFSPFPFLSRSLSLFSSLIVLFWLFTGRIGSRK